MKVLKVLAWVGVGFIALGLTLSFSSSITWTSTGQLGSGVGYWLAWVLGISGTILMLAGGFVAKPRYLWIGAIVIGLVYISSFYAGIPWWAETNKRLAGSATMLSPGVVCIIGGIIVQRLSSKSSKAIWGNIAR